MLYLDNGQPTTLLPGDVLEFDPDNHMTKLMRDDQFLRNDKGDSEYWIMPTDGEQFDIIAQLLADVAGLTVEEIKEAENPTYRFK